MYVLNFRQRATIRSWKQPVSARHSAEIRGRCRLVCTKGANQSPAQYRLHTTEPVFSTLTTVLRPNLERSEHLFIFVLSSPYRSLAARLGYINVLLDGSGVWSMYSVSHLYPLEWTGTAKAQVTRGHV